LEVNYFPGPGQIVLGTRTGGANQHHHFDNMSLLILAASNGRGKKPVDEFAMRQNWCNDYALLSLKLTDRLEKTKDHQARCDLLAKLRNFLKE